MKNRSKVMGTLGGAAGNIGGAMNTFALATARKRKLTRDEENDVYGRLMKANQAIHEVAKMLEGEKEQHDDELRSMENPQ